MATDSEPFLDLIQSESTFMTQICKNIFDYNTSTVNIGTIKRINCQNWFIEAFGHCSQKLLDQSEKHSTLSQLIQYLNLHSFFTTKNINSNEESSLTASHPHLKIEPQLMSSSDCNHFFLEIAQDYIYVAPKFLLCSEEISYIESTLRALFGLILIYAFYRTFKYFARNHKKKLHWYISSEKEQKLLGKIYYEKKEKSIVNELLKRTIYECQHLKYLKKKPLQLRPDQLTLLLKVQNHNVLNAMSIFIKSPPIWERYKNGVISEKAISSCDYAEYKIKNFLNDTQTFRVILEYEIEKHNYENNENDIKHKKMLSQNRFQLETIDEVSFNQEEQDKEIEPPSDQGTNLNDKLDSSLSKQKKYKSSRTYNQCYCKLIKRSPSSKKCNIKKELPSPSPSPSRSLSPSPLPSPSSSSSSQVTNDIKKMKSNKESDKTFWTVLEPKNKANLKVKNQSKFLSKPRSQSSRNHQTSKNIPKK